MKWSWARSKVVGVVSEQQFIEHHQMHTNVMRSPHLDSVRIVRHKRLGGGHVARGQTAHEGCLATIVHCINKGVKRQHRWVTKRVQRMAVEQGFAGFATGRTCPTNPPICWLCSTKRTFVAVHVDVSRTAGETSAPVSLGS